MNSDELNFLVWKYLQEENLPLAAAALDRETQVSRWDRDDAPVGELVALVLKGRQLVAIESEVGRRRAAASFVLPPKTPIAVSGLHRVDYGVTLPGGSSVAGTSSGVLVAAAETAQFFSAADGALRTLESGGDVPTALAALAPGRAIVGYASGALRVWAFERSELEALLVAEAASAPVLLLAVDPAGRRALTVDVHNAVRAWDLESRALLGEQQHSSHAPIVDCCWIGDGRAAVVSRESVAVLDLAPCSAPTDDAGADADAAGGAAIPARQPGIQGACIALADRLLGGSVYIGTNAGEVRTFRAQEAAASSAASADVSAFDQPVDQPVTFKAHAVQVSALARCGSRLLTTSLDGGVALWEPHTHTECVRTNVGEPVLLAKVNEAGSCIAVMTPGSVRVLRAGSLEAAGEIRRAGAQDVAWWGDALVVTSEDGTEVFKA